MIRCYIENLQNNNILRGIDSGGGDKSVERFSVMIGVWGQADKIKLVCIFL